MKIRREYVEPRPYNKLVGIPFSEVEINDKFWRSRQKLNGDISVFKLYDKLEEYHQIDNFRVAAGKKEGLHLGEFYYDSDLYKWLEGACRIYLLNKDDNLKRIIDSLVNLIEKSQLSDGYINTYFSTKFPEKRFKNLLILHELYCCGHLIQTAIAHYNATKSKKLLNVAQRFADLLIEVFLNEKIKDAPGHPEIEMALIELSQTTKNLEYLKLAEHFILMRGNIPHYRRYAIKNLINMKKTLELAVELDNQYYRDNNISEVPKSEVAEFFEDLKAKELLHLFIENLNGKMYQHKTPIREETEPVGHCVRATYFYTGVAELYAETGDESLLTALESIWQKMVEGRMYITGGIGSIRGTEGFQKDFKLKPENSYSETCAAIGNIMWNWELLKITGKCEYADLIEKLLYNAFLVGQSIEGSEYFYENKLVSNGEDERKIWYKCACCPTNFIRFIPSLGKYVYSLSEQGIWIHQYIGSRVGFDLEDNTKFNLFQKTGFPWKGNNQITISLDNPKEFSLFFRIPKWSKKTQILVNDEPFKKEPIPGSYLEIKRKWVNNDKIDIDFEMIPRLLKGDRRNKSIRNKVAITYGPLIYCMEQIDNEDFDIFEARFSEKTELTTELNPNLIEGLVIIRGELKSGKKFKAIPYFSWCNRGSTKMQVWHKIK
ncbi:MAG: hypothetical protein GF353_28515 [Candidatus Lokiarchaeota archaeon]|nr:hypothetical protein [Candidatus Lokiarchaeota archaeon]